MDRLFPSTPGLFHPVPVADTSMQLLQSYKLSEGFHALGLLRLCRLPVPPHTLVLPPRHSSFCLSTFAHAVPHPFPSKALLTLQASLETLPPSGTIPDPPSPSFNRSPSNTRQKGARCSADRENPTADRDSDTTCWQIPQGLHRPTKQTRRTAENPVADGPWQPHPLLPTRHPCSG